MFVHLSGPATREHGRARQCCYFISCPQILLGCGSYFCWFLLFHWNVDGPCYEKSAISKTKVICLAYFLFFTSLYQKYCSFVKIFKFVVIFCTVNRIIFLKPLFFISKGGNCFMRQLGMKLYFW